MIGMCECGHGVSGGDRVTVRVIVVVSVSVRVRLGVRVKARIRVRLGEAGDDEGVGWEVITLAVWACSYSEGYGWACG